MIYHRPSLTDAVDQGDLIDDCPLLSVASFDFRAPDDLDLRQLHTIRLDVLSALCASGRRLARLETPYREHLSKHFADSYSRIGLPEPYESE